MATTTEHANALTFDLDCASVDAVPAADINAPVEAAPDARLTDGRRPPARQPSGRVASRNQRAGRPTTRTPPPHTHYLDLERKETRLRADQYGQLTEESRRLNRLRRGEGERLTENTLIRVAVDLLLSHRESLSGVTEDQLRKSVGL